MNDSRITGLLEALTRFAERLAWLRRYEGVEEPASQEEAREVLAEWALLEPHLELLEAMVGTQELAELQVRVDALRLQLRAAFLVAVGRLLIVSQLRWTNEALLKVPAALRKLPPAEEQKPAVVDALTKLRGMLKELPEPEQMFRESMVAADNCEARLKTLNQQLLQDWPEDWTPEMQSRYEQQDSQGAMAWMNELRCEAAEVEKKLAKLRESL